MVFGKKNNGENEVIDENIEEQYMINSDNQQDHGNDDKKRRKKSKKKMSLITMSQLKLLLKSDKLIFKKETHGFIRGKLEKNIKDEIEKMKQIFAFNAKNGKKKMISLEDVMNYYNTEFPN